MLYLFRTGSGGLYRINGLGSVSILDMWWEGTELRDGICIEVDMRLREL